MSVFPGSPGSFYLVYILIPGPVSDPGNVISFNGEASMTVPQYTGEEGR